MPAEEAVEAAELPELVLRKVTLLREKHVKREAPMSLAQDETVAVFPARPLRVVAQHVVVENAQDLDQRERGCEVAAAGAIHDFDDFAPEFERSRVQPCHCFCHVVHSACAL
jgi:hypothetical protein